MKKIKRTHSFFALLLLCGLVVGILSAPVHATEIPHEHYYTYQSDSVFHRMICYCGHITDESRHTGFYWSLYSADQHRRVCRDCGYAEFGAHVFSDWNVEKPATEEHEGLEERTCAECAQRQTRTVEKLVPVETTAETTTMTITEATTTTEVTTVETTSELEVTEPVSSETTAETTVATTTATTMETTTEAEVVVSPVEKNSGTWAIIIVLVAIVAIAGLSFVFYKKKSNKNP